MPFKSVFERNPLCILHKRHRLENWERSNGPFDWLNNLFQPIKKPVRTLFSQSEMPWKTWQPTPETNPARSLPRLCPSVTTMSKPCCPLKETANAQFDTSVQLLQSQPPMQMSDCLKSTQQQPTVPAIRQRAECRKQNAQTFFIFMDGTFSVAPHPFKQLYTIRVPFKDVTGTAVYALLPN